MTSAAAANPILHMAECLCGPLEVNAYDVTAWAESSLVGELMKIMRLCGVISVGTAEWSDADDKDCGLVTF